MCDVFTQLEAGLIRERAVTGLATVGRRHWRGIEAEMDPVCSWSRGRRAACTAIGRFRSGVEANCGTSQSAELAG